MLSRVADSIFWMNRYLERAENVARFVDVNLNLTLDLGENAPDQWEPLIMTTGDHQQFFARHPRATAESVIEFLAFDGEYPNSILACLRSARENARTVSNALLDQDGDALSQRHLTDWSFQWGQWLTHDMDLTPNGAQFNVLSDGTTGDFRIRIEDRETALGEPLRDGRLAARHAADEADRERRDGSERFLHANPGAPIAPVRPRS